jgi:anaerobic magnesium-protoporphyrin IX monomethyl ester cyclase
MARINFVYVNIQVPGFNSFGKGFEGTLISHGVASLITVLRQRGHSVTLYDFRKLASWHTWDQICQSADADFWCFSYLSTDYLHGKKAIEILRKNRPNALVIVGGAHASLSETIEDEIDATWIIQGEGEISLPEIIEQNWIKDSHCNSQCFGEKERIIHGKSPHLDELPFIDRKIFGIEEMCFNLFPELTQPVLTMVLGRGCIFSCRFCSDRMRINGPPRMRSVENIMAELQQLKDHYSYQSIMFHDDLVAKSSWIEKFIEQFRTAFGSIPFFMQIHPRVIYERKDLITELAKIGLSWISLGIESGSDRILEFIHKETTKELTREAVAILRENKIKIFGNFVLGFPTESHAEALETAQFIEEIKPERLSPSIYTLFPGSWLYDYCKENDLILNENWSTYSPCCKKIKGVDYGFLKRIQQRIAANVS